MRLFQEKKLKLEKQLREVKPEVVQNIVMRYERFCQDQNTYTMLQWRKKIDYFSLSTKQRVALDLRMAMSKCYRGYKLTNFKGEVNHNPDSLGTFLTFLPNCLDPETDVRKLEKFVVGQNILDEDDLCLCKISENMPIEFNFYPTEQIMKKLVMRSL